MADTTTVDATATDAVDTGRAASLKLVTFTLLRVGAGLLFMQHGAQKLFGALGGTSVELVSQLGLAGVLEFFGGLLIAVGLLTRPVAAVLVALMVAAYFIAHFPQGGFPIENRGELALLFALIFTYLAAMGPGKWSLDAKLLPKLT